MNNVAVFQQTLDTFHGYNKEQLLSRFERDLPDALTDKISLNPILDAFQITVNEYNIPYDYIDAFLKMDLEKKQYLSKHETEKYVYGSANVVGLMCLKVFFVKTTPNYFRNW